MNLFILIILIFSLETGALEGVATIGFDSITDCMAMAIYAGDQLTQDNPFSEVISQCVESPHVKANT